MYKYTLLKQDGTTEDLGITSRRKEFQELYTILNCRTIELIPSPYHPDGLKNAVVYGDEEGRFNSDNVRNPHMKVLAGNPSIGEPAEWDTVGDLVVEQKVRAERKET